MAEIYDIFKLDADFSSKDYTVERTRSIMSELLARADTLLTNGVKDVAAKIKTELIMKKCIFGYDNPVVKIFMEDAASDYATLTKADKRAVDSVLRDLIDNYEADIAGKDFETAVPYLDILDEYIEFKSKIDDVSPETAAEIDRLANMTDEEFEAEINKPDKEEEEETEEVDTPITLHDFETLSIAELIAKYGSHDTAKCLIDADGGEEKLMQSSDLDLFDAEDQELLTKEFGIAQDAPNTEEFNPDYDIPDEKLYPQE